MVQYWSHPNAVYRHAYKPVLCRVHQRGRCSEFTGAVLKQPVPIPPERRNGPGLHRSILEHVDELGDAFHHQRAQQLIPDRRSERHQCAPLLPHQDAVNGTARTLSIYRQSRFKIPLASLESCSYIARSFRTKVTLCVAPKGSKRRNQWPNVSKSLPPAKCWVPTPADAICSPQKTRNVAAGSAKERSLTKPTPIASFKISPSATDTTVIF